LDGTGEHAPHDLGIFINAGRGIRDGVSARISGRLSWCDGGTSQQSRKDDSETLWIHGVTPFEFGGKWTA
jgi:hypothetical protein